jgi:hypothetical protein
MQASGVTRHCSAAQVSSRLDAVVQTSISRIKWSALYDLWTSGAPPVISTRLCSLGSCNHSFCLPRLPSLCPHAAKTIGRPPRSVQLRDHPGALAANGTALLRGAKTTHTLPCAPAFPV